MAAPAPPETGHAVPVPPVPPVPPIFRHGQFPGFEMGFGPHDAPYAFVDKDGKQGPGRWVDNQKIARARKQAHGAFLWFERDGKSYIVDDPAIVAQLEANRKSMEEVGRQMRELGAQQREESRKLAEQARKLRETASIQVPDLSKEMEDLNKAMATLKTKQGTSISSQELRELERQLSQMQRRLAEAQFRGFAFDGAVFKQGGFGKFSEQMGQLGGQMGKQARENDEKTRSIIDESLKNGKAHPVE